MPEKPKDLKLQDVWRTCNKVQAAIFRVGLNLWDYYGPLDPNKKSLISESKFTSILAGPLKPLIGLTNKEIFDLADYFRIQDGRILYAQFCNLIHHSVPEFDKQEDLVTGLEWEDPLHVNVVSPIEQRKLDLIITQIALLLKKRNLVLRPYFQDYELVSKNNGTVTFAHFGRILKFLGITLAPHEFCLLIKRFAKDGYTVNYVAFLKAIDDVHNYFEKHGMLSLDGTLLDVFPGKVVTADLPKLPRPEIGKKQTSEVFQKQSVFHPVLDWEKEAMPRMEIIQRVQRHILEHRIHISEFFKAFDPLNIGKITVSQFRRGLDALLVSSLGKLCLTESEISDFIDLYRDPDDSERVCWKSFEELINLVFNVKNLEKMPSYKVETPPQGIVNLRRKGLKEWRTVSEDKRRICEELISKIRCRVQSRGLGLRDAFRDYDRHNHGHVTRAQFRQILKTLVILLSEEEEYALEQRYNDDQGFNYFSFVDEVESKPVVEPIYEEMLKEKQRINAEKPRDRGEMTARDETDLVLILAKIKAKVVREGIKVCEFMRPYDRLNHSIISKSDFIRSLDLLRCNLSVTEMESIVKAFRSPSRSGFVEYTRFAEIVEEAVYKGYLEKTPLTVPTPHVPSEACTKTFLNFEERRLVELALDKLSKVSQPNLIEIFMDYDKENIGTVCRNQLVRALSERNMYDMLTNRELDAIHKCFSVERGGRLEIDYRAFLKAIHFLQESRKTSLC
ncbi:EF-hand calcium-binding domain-containing protein 6 [Prorops nasuta]|uniref:EF-hand calcium-binding domain-containing protein 6 n=1 Tax=Prorops nasuta TaxID=863751 RepID=UPI0034CFE09A